MRLLYYGIFFVSFLCAQPTKTLNVIFLENFPPHQVIQEGKPSGFAIDILRYIEKDLNLKLNYVHFKNEADFWEKITQGDFDIIPNMGVCPQRMAFIAFSAPFDVGYMSLFVRSNEGFQTIEEMHGKTIGIHKTSIAKKFFTQKYPDIALKLYHSKEEAFVDLISGKIDGMAYLEGPIIALTELFGVEEKVKKIAILKEVQRAIGVKKGDTELLNSINTSLAKLKASDEYQRMYEKWHAYPAKKKYTQDELNRLIMLGFGILCFIGLVLFFIAKANRRLHKEVKQRIQVQQALEQNEERFRTFFEHNASVMIIVNPSDATIIDVNKEAETFYGYPKTSMQGMSIASINELPKEELFPKMQKAVNAEINHLTLKHRLCSGEIRDVEIYAGPIITPKGKVLFAIVHDITERKRHEEQLKLAATVFRAASEGIVITDAENNIIDVNDAFTKISGYTKEEVLGENPRLLKSDKHPKSFYEEMWKILLEKGTWQGEIWNKNKQGVTYPEMLTMSIVYDKEGQIQNYIGFFNDISERKKYELRLEYLAHNDALTGLPNRILFADRLHQAMLHAKRKKTQLAVVYLDLDGFKSINDSFGHHTGDAMLIAFANAMKAMMREGDTIARIGGDEFVVLLSNLTDSQESLPIVIRLLHTASQPLLVNEIQREISASAGISFYPQIHEVDAEQLIRQSDQAMYQAKLAGKNNFRIFDTISDQDTRLYFQDVQSISDALKNKEFVLFYQPKVNMKTGAVTGVEALIRWQHPKRGLLPPHEFLHIIENHPLSIKLGRWVIKTALEQMSQWKDDGISLHVSVNISAHELQESHFTRSLKKILSLFPNISPSWLQLEILETSALENIAHTATIIQACKELGVSIALDDFGTGYSSLTYLRRLSIDTLKIDKSFVIEMLNESDDLSILEGIIGLSKAFNHNVIAEGVESVEHGTLLLQLGCQFAQGYYIAKPMPSAAIPQWIATWKPDKAWTKQNAVPKEDVPLLFAATKHRAWVHEVQQYLQNKISYISALNAHECRFGKWLHEGEKEQYALQEPFQNLTYLHDAVHLYGTKAIECKQNGTSEEAKEWLEKMLHSSRLLLENLNQLIR